MRIQSIICFANDNKTIVKCEAWEDESLIGCAIGEEKNAEIAEDRAISRLQQRIKRSEKQPDEQMEHKLENKNLDHLNLDINKNSTESEKARNQSEIKDVPFLNDWSEELSLIDNELKRLQWDREKENKYIKDLFGYSNRNMITKFSEITELLSKLKLITIETNKEEEEEEEKKINKEELIEQSNILLTKLKWNKDIGRTFLLKNFKQSTRYQLGDKQLIEFISLLKKELTIKETTNLNN
tara:strand:+ start:53 stop:772 length:720 start_codon:yes stop_codon:yes gene_type:complete